nr:N-acetylmuramoyl-L-alanine amidase [Lysinibacillus timonensis]
MSLIAISPGHFSPGSGARDIIDEVTEARKVVDRIVQLLNNAGIGVTHIEDNTSKNRSDNLDYLITQHNRATRSLDVSVHFNSTNGRHETAIGTEVLYMNDRLKGFASNMSKAIANASGLRNRGAKKRTNLAFLNSTNKSAILIEVCFVNSVVDVALYREYFEDICIAIANQLIQQVKPGHTLIRRNEQPQPNNQKTESDEINSGIKNTLTKQHFTAPTLIDNIEDILTDEVRMRKIIEKGIEEKVFTNVWIDRLNNGSMTTSDFLALCTLIVSNSIK